MEQTPQTQSKSNWLIELLKFAFIAIVIVLPFRMYVAQPFIVSGASMSPTFSNGDYLIVDELSYHFSRPERGDVIVFKYPKDPSKFFIKRVIGLPNETIGITNGEITVTNEQEELVLNEPYIASPTLSEPSITLGSDEYFVLGDNRGASSDSRRWGPLDEEFIVGRAFLRLLPVTHADILPGYFNPSL